MLPVAWRSQAEDDLDNIAEYISQYNPLAAKRLTAEIRASVEPLPQNPLMYRKSGRIPGCREIVVHRNYIVIYRIETDRIRIMRVVHARRMYL